MSRPILLLDIGAGALPATTPPATVAASWVPAVYAPPATPVPGVFAATVLVDAVLLTWAAITAASPLYVVERAPDVAGAPGAWVTLARTADLTYTAAVANGSTYWWRVKATVFGRSSAATAQLKVTAITVAGRGINLVPDPVSTFEAATLPAGLAGTNATLSRVVGFVDGSGALRATAGAVGNYCYWEPTAVSHRFGHLAGRKYIVSAMVRTSRARAAGDVQMYLREVSIGIAVATATASALTANTWTRVSAVVDPAAVGISVDRSMVAFVLLNNTVAGDWFDTDALMVEEAIVDYNKPSAYARGTANGVALSALVQAQDARALVDNQIDIYRQSAAPSIGGTGAKLGDYWQDADDGKWWYCNGSSWVESTDSRLPQAVIDAAAAQSAANTAQTTANARIRLFVQETQPSGGTYIVGDQWFTQSTKLTRYYNGAGWSLQADQTAAMSTMSVINPMFAAGTEGWSGWSTLVPNTVGVGWIYQTTNGIGGSGRAYIGGAVGLSRLVNDANVNSRFPVKAGQKVVLAGRFARNVVAADNIAYIGAFYYDVNGAWVGNEDVPIQLSELPTGGWVAIRKTVIAPTGTAFATMNVMAGPGAGGAWAIDNVSMSLAKDLDSEVQDGTTYARPRQTELQGGVVLGRAFGANLVPNGAFSLNNVGTALNAFITPLQPGTDNWIVQTSVPQYHGMLVEDSGGYRHALIRLRSDAVIAANQGYIDSGFDTASFIEVQGGRQYILRAKHSNSASVGIPAGVVVLQRTCIYWYDVTGAFINEAALDRYNQWGDWEWNYPLDAPVNAKRAKIRLMGFVSNSNAYTVSPAGGLWADMRWRDVALNMAADMDSELLHGTTYGKTANTDLYDSGGVRRIGTSVKGSRKMLGGARNSRASLVYGAAAVRTTTSLTANSSGQVTVNAHSVEISGETVVYNAVTNAVTGLTVGVTYVIFTLDPFLDGGTRTYYAQTSILSAQQAGEGAVLVGNATIPAGGTSSGGGGGGGDPGTWCVEWDSVLPDGRLVRELSLGDRVLCIDVVTGEVGDFPLLGMGFGEEECYRLVTPELHSIVQSRSTPMNLPNGTVLTTDRMFGKPVYIPSAAGPKLSLVCDLQYLGVRRVVKPDFGSRMFFAGERADATIATHNADYKQ